MSDPLILPEHDWQTALMRAGEAGDERPTWAYDWPAGSRLADNLHDLVDCRGKRICDLGCGRGRLGLRALGLGADLVCFADGSRIVLDYLHAVVAANKLEERAACRLHAWGDPIPDGPYDVILGGDILYRPECFAALLGSIAASLSDDGLALLSDPRGQLEARLPALAATAGLGWESGRHEAGFTLVRCGRR